MGPRAGLDDVNKWKFLTLPGLEFRPLGSKARSQSLYRPRYRNEEQEAKLQVCNTSPSHFTYWRFARLSTYTSSVIKLWLNDLGMQ
jgi:hypothetical protein